jgi:hypothetical protein
VMEIAGVDRYRDIQAIRWSSESMKVASRLKDSVIGRVGKKQEPCLAQTILPKETGLTASLNTSFPSFNSCNLLSVGSRIYCFSNSTVRVLNPSYTSAKIYQLKPRPQLLYPLEGDVLVRSGCVLEGKHILGLGTRVHSSHLGSLI